MSKELEKFRIVIAQDEMHTISSYSLKTDEATPEEIRLMLDYTLGVNEVKFEDATRKWADELSVEFIEEGWPDPRKRIVFRSRSEFATTEPEMTKLEETLPWRGCRYAIDFILEFCEPLSDTFWRARMLRKALSFSDLTRETARLSAAFEMGRLQEIRNSRLSFRDGFKRGLEAKAARSKGGRTRARQDRDQTVEFMRGKIKEGAKIADAARWAFAKKLGSSAKANVATWKRYGDGFK